MHAGQIALSKIPAIAHKYPPVSVGTPRGEVIHLVENVKGSCPETFSRSYHNRGNRFVGVNWFKPGRLTVNHKFPKGNRCPWIDSYL